MNDDLERLEALRRDIVAARGGKRSDAKIWDCLERLGQDVLRMESQQWQSQDSEGESGSEPCQ